MRARLKAALLGPDSVLPRRAAISLVRRRYRVGEALSNRDIAFYLENGVEFGTFEFQKYLRAGLLSAPDSNVIHQARLYQGQTIGRSLDPVLHLAFHKLLGAQEAKLLPGTFCLERLLPFLNDWHSIGAYSDKNVYSRLMSDVNQPGTLLKNVNGNYYDSVDKPLARSAVSDYLAQAVSDAIIKPSRTDNGQQIASLKQEDNKLTLGGKPLAWQDIESRYRTDFIVQEKIDQHALMSEPHPESVNTLRILTLRWEGEIHFLLAFARFGSAGSVNDNAGTGGVCVGVDDAGHLMNYAVNASVQKLERHPTTGYHFASKRAVPAFSRAKQLCLDIHRDILHHNLVSWDIAIDRNAEPVFVEYNFRGALWLYQLATARPILGEFSDSILKAMRAGARCT